MIFLYISRKLSNQNIIFGPANSNSGIPNMAFTGGLGAPPPDEKWGKTQGNLGKSWISKVFSPSGRPRLSFVSPLYFCNGMLGFNEIACFYGKPT